MRSRTTLLFSAVVFVVYGSLLPLDFRRLLWDEVAVGFLGLGCVFQPIVDGVSG